MADLPVTVITTCTSRKAAGSAVRAERLYTGEQQRRLMQGVDELRRSLPVETWIISAKAGLVSGDELLSPYDSPSPGSTDTNSGATPRHSASRPRSGALAAEPAQPDAPCGRKRILRRGAPGRACRLG